MEKLKSDPSVGSMAAGCPSLARISKSARNDSSEKRSMSVEETSHPPSSRPPSKISRRRATSQIASPVVDFEVAIAEKPRRTTQSRLPEEEPKSYYLINPKVPGSAWYITTGKRNSNRYEYEVERVPAHLVHIQQNRIGYLIETAIRDDVTGAVADRSVSWTPRRQNEPSTITPSPTEKAANATGPQPGKRVKWFERDDSEGEVNSQLHDESSIIVEHRDIPLITKNIIRQLRIAGFKQNRPSMEGDEFSWPGDDQELEDAIKACLIDFRRSEHHSNGPEAEEQEAYPQQGKLPAQPAWESATRHMQPRPSVVADPAITLSTSQTVFTAADSSHEHNGQRETPSTTRLASPHSVTANTRTKHGGRLGERSASPASTGSLSYENSAAVTRRTSSSNGLNQDQELETSQASIASTITSFPKLLSRHCTREWIKPIVNLEDTSTSSSHQAINAEAADLPHHHPQTPSAEDPMSMSWAGDTLRSSNASGYFMNEAPSARRSTVSQSSMRRLKGFGTHIGSAAHRRRSAPVDELQAPPSQDHFFPNLLGKFFVSRSRESPGSPDSGETPHTGALAPYNTPAHDHLPVTTPKSGCGSPPKRTATVSLEDRARIHEALVGGGGAAVDRRRRDTCSEDNRPHVCADDMDH
ncbi:hypothetical protein J3F83DRAFT_730411 [Trichoderma novae-zelandiae]